MAGSALEYIASVQSQIEALGATFERIEPRQLDEEGFLASLIGIARFPYGYRLHFLIVVDTRSLTESILKDRFHLEDSNRRTVVRFDNAPHHPQLRTFPHHQHEGPDESLVESGFVGITEILTEIGIRIGGT